jgi:hypothetical protein
MPNESRDDQIFALVAVNRLVSATVFLVVALIGWLVLWIIKSL